MKSYNYRECSDLSDSTRTVHLCQFSEKQSLKGTFLKPTLDDSTIVYYISNEYNRNAGLTVDRRSSIVSIYIAIPLLDAALHLKSLMKNGPMR